jgi:hypothetical protein
MKPIMKFHPSLKKIFKEIDAWLAYEESAGSVEQDTNKINDYLNSLIEIIAMLLPIPNIENFIKLVSGLTPSNSSGISDII